jgi:hypothetical protein
MKTKGVVLLLLLSCGLAAARKKAKSGDEPVSWDHGTVLVYNGPHPDRAMPYNLSWCLQGKSCTYVNSVAVKVYQEDRVLQLVERSETPVFFHRDSAVDWYHTKKGTYVFLDSAGNKHFFGLQAITAMSGQVRECYATQVICYALVGASGFAGDDSAHEPIPQTPETASSGECEQHPEDEYCQTAETKRAEQMTRRYCDQHPENEYCQK